MIHISKYTKQPPRKHHHGKKKKKKKPKLKLDHNQKEKPLIKDSNITCEAPIVKKAKLSIFNRKAKDMSVISEVASDELSMKSRERSDSTNPNQMPAAKLKFLNGKVIVADDDSLTNSCSNSVVGDHRVTSIIDKMDHRRRKQARGDDDKMEVIKLPLKSSDIKSMKKQNNNISISRSSPSTDEIHDNI